VPKVAKNEKRKTKSKVKAASKTAAKKTTSKKVSKKRVKKDLKAPIRRTSSKTAGRQGEPTTMEPRKAQAQRGKEPVPTTMEELLKVTGYKLKAPKRGEVMEGLVTEISKKIVLVDIGGKTEGIVVDREYEAARDLIVNLEVGDKIQVFVVSPENERGQILLSLRKAAVDKKWEDYEEYLETGDAVDVRGLEVNKGGLIVAADSLRGFVPSSQFGDAYLGRMEELLNKTFKVKVIEVSQDKNRLIFSEKLVSEADALAKRKQALKWVKVGDIYEGVISGIMPFGAFVTVKIPMKKGKGQKVKSETGEDEEVAKMEGLIHISEISWEKVDDPNDYFKLGDKVKVKVLGVEESSGKLNLSVKQITDDPWNKVEKKYPVGAKVKGKITRVAPFGAFVTIEPGIDGLIHISKIPAGEEPKIGSEVEVFVDTVDKEQRRMSLGMVLKEVPVGYK
jgi:small subunit ribosomal protein S1